VCAVSNFDGFRNLEWLHNGQSLPENRNETVFTTCVTTATQLYIPKTYTQHQHCNAGFWQVLNLSDMSTMDNGMYQCIVEGHQGQVAMGVAKVEVGQPRPPLALPLVQSSNVLQPEQPRMPFIISATPDRRVRPGGSVNLKCIAGGSPQPILTWRLNGKVLVLPSSKDLWTKLVLTTFTYTSTQKLFFFTVSRHFESEWHHPRIASEWCDPITGWFIHLPGWEYLWQGWEVVTNRSWWEAVYSGNDLTAEVSGRSKHCRVDPLLIWRLSHWQDFVEQRW
jgi:hypothetical protein